MKPSKNLVYCPDCGKPKMLFESESKAMNFIKFNKDEMESEGKKVPSRAYYCQCCCGYHLTSTKGHTDGIANTGSVIDAYNQNKEMLSVIRHKELDSIVVLQRIHAKLKHAVDKGVTPTNNELNELANMWNTNYYKCNAKKLKKRVISMFVSYGAKVNDEQEIHLQ